MCINLYSRCIGRHTACPWLSCWNMALDPIAVGTHCNPGAQILSLNPHGSPATRPHTSQHPHTPASITGTHPGVARAGHNWRSQGGHLKYSLRPALRILRQGSCACAKVRHAQAVMRERRRMVWSLIVDGMVWFGGWCCEGFFAISYFCTTDLSVFCVDYMIRL